jgi:pimeloyl-ACP methyl ester carboxylesterase
VAVTATPIYDERAVRRVVQGWDMQRWSVVLITVLALAVSASPVAAATSRTNDRAKPVILVHGFDVEGNPGTDCGATWDDLKGAFRSWGYTGPLVATAYYAYDAGCDHAIGHHGDHATHFATGHTTTGGHTANTDIRHLGYHLAWYVYEHWTSQEQPVDLVGHSMGGLVIRYAIAQVERGDPEFPPRLLVEDVVTFGTPHAGTRFALACAAFYRQCAQMRPESSFMTWLRTYAAEPDGATGTDWTTMGSQADELVSTSSANAMAACHEVSYLATSRIRHTDYQHLRSRARSADATHRDCPGAWVTSYDYWWPVRRADLALTFGGS